MSKDVREFVRLNYARAISQKKGCCGDSRGGGCCGGSGGLTIEAVTAGLYQPDELDGPLREAAGASFGCGNPTALADLRPGEVVLDLGCGAGLDVLLAARRVAPGGKAYGLDMTGEMLAEARSNKERSGIENAEFLKGHIEEIPLPENSVDVIISNCVINLSPAKDRVLREACRVLKPGGLFRFASDIPSYVDWTLLAVTADPHFAWTAEDADDWRLPFPGWPGTRYEQKAIREGRRGTYLTFRRL